MKLTVQPRRSGTIIWQRSARLGRKNHGHQATANNADVHATDASRVQGMDLPLESLRCLRISANASRCGAGLANDLVRRGPISMRSPRSLTFNARYRKDIIYITALTFAPRNMLLPAYPLLIASAEAQPKASRRTAASAATIIASHDI